MFVCIKARDNLTIRRGVFPAFVSISKIAVESNESIE